MYVDSIYTLLFSWCKGNLNHVQSSIYDMICSIINHYITVYYILIMFNVMMKKMIMLLKVLKVSQVGCC